MIQIESTSGMLPLPSAETYALDLNTVMQTVATVALWAGTVALLLYAIKLARSDRSPLPIFIVLAVAAGSLIEPIYDITYHLFWLDNGDQWTLFTSFGLPQPVWVMPAYVVVFALPAVMLYRSFAAGVSQVTIFTWAGVTACTTALFETIAINLDLYVYYGEAPLRFLEYPLWISFMEGAQIIGFAVLCAVIRLRATKPAHTLIVFIVFPANFAFETIGAGFPTLIAQNAPDPSTALIWATAPVSIGLAAAALWWTSQVLFTTQRLAELEGRTPEVPGMTRTQRVAAALWRLPCSAAL